MPYIIQQGKAWAKNGGFSPGVDRESIGNQWGKTGKCVSMLDAGSGDFIAEKSRHSRREDVVGSKNNLKSPSSRYAFEPGSMF